MCIDSLSTNKIIVNYSFLIPILVDMHNQLSGARIFSKIDETTPIFHV